jgi:membrane protease YdiL (CAAX protease family)
MDVVSDPEASRYSKEWICRQLGLQLVLSLALAPIAAELFFRGWLWFGLRRGWGTVPVVIVTAMAWLGLHFIDAYIGLLLLFRSQCS